jgi:hypothetical protein
VPEVFDEDEEDYPVALLHEFLMNSYAVFLTEGLETFPDQEQALRERYGTTAICCSSSPSSRSPSQRPRTSRLIESLKRTPKP